MYNKFLHREKFDVNFKQANDTLKSRNLWRQDHQSHHVTMVKLFFLCMCLTGTVNRKTYA